jgi:P4 family phage/plasmid primase-like protien
MNLLAHAVSYRSLGISVFPMISKTKKPLVKWKRYQTEFPTEDQLSEWFKEGLERGIGCATGKIVVVDCDSEDAIEFAEKQGMPTTVCSRTRRGRHYFYSVPAGMTIHCIPQDKFCGGVGIDIKGTGGLVVLPPSVHPTGFIYQWINNPADWPIAPCPSWIIAEVAKHSAKKTARIERPKQQKEIKISSSTTTRYGKKALTDECSSIMNSTVGNRNHQLNSSSFKIATLVSAGEIDKDEAITALEVSAENAGLENHEIKKTIDSAFSAGMSNPRTVSKHTASVATAVFDIFSETDTEPEYESIFDEVEEETPSQNTNKITHDNSTKDRYYSYIVEKELPKIRCIKDRWYRDLDSYWELFDKSVLLPFVLDRIRNKDMTRRLADNVLNLIEGLRQVTSTEEFHSFHLFDPDSENAILLNVLNGILKVTPNSIELVERKLKNIFTARIDTNFNKTSTCPIFIKTLKNNVNDEQDMETLTLSAANILYPSSCAEACLVMIGKAGTGKSTIADAIANVFGTSIVTNIPMSMICDPKSFSLPRLETAGLNLASELDSIELADSAYFKSLVSGESIEVRPIYKEAFTMKTTCKFWFLANHLPRFKHGSGAEIRRIRFVEFLKVPEVIDTSLKDKLRREKEGIFNLILYQLQQFMQNPNIPVNGASKNIEERFVKSNDPIGWYAKEFLEFNPEFDMLKDNLYSHFIDTCEDNGISYHPEPHNFFKQFLDKFTTVKPFRPGYTERIRMVKGVRRKPITGEENAV